MPAKKKNWKDNHINPQSKLLEDLPDWFKNSKTAGATFAYSVSDRFFVWYGGFFKSDFICCAAGDGWKKTWLGGTFDGYKFEGTWHDGYFNGEVFKGIFENGTFYKGQFINSEFFNGTFCERAEFKNSKLFGGVFEKGIWVDGNIMYPKSLTINFKIDNDKNFKKEHEKNKLFLAAVAGIYFDEKGYGIAYRKTRKEGKGCYTHSYIQKKGKFEVEIPALAGEGTCCSGIHVCSPFLALTYFNPEPGDILWQVKFHKDDLLDCDGQKLRIRKGTAKKVPWNFVPTDHVVHK